MFFNRIVGTALLGAFIVFLAPGAAQNAHAQMYKWVDKDGAVHYGDNPYSIDKDSQVETKKTAPSQKEKTPARESAAPATQAEAEPADKAEEPGRDEPQGSGELSPGQKAIELVGEIEIMPGITGAAMIRARLKNVYNRPVDGIRLDVILFHVERRRAADLAIPLTSGKKAPSRLDPGEVGVIEYDTDLEVEQIAGYRYRIVWAYHEFLPKPPEGSVEGVTHVIRSKSTGKVRMPGEGASAEPEEQPTAPPSTQPEPEQPPR